MHPISPRISKYPISIALPDLERLLPIYWPLFAPNYPRLWYGANYQRRCPAGGLSMWFKVFVLVRIPISLVCLSGWAMLLQDSGAVFSLMALGMLTLLVFVSIRLFQFHEDAPGLAVSLLLLEMVGVDLVMAKVNYSGSNGTLN